MNKKNKEINTIVLEEDETEEQQQIVVGDEQKKGDMVDPEKGEEAKPTDEELKAKLDELKTEEATKADEGDDLNVEIEYVGEIPHLDDRDPYFFHFAKIFNTFKVFSLIPHNINVHF